MFEEGKECLPLLTRPASCQDSDHYVEDLLAHEVVLVSRYYLSKLLTD